MVGMERLAQSWDNFWDTMLDSKLVLNSPKQSSPSHCGHWLEKSTLVTPSKDFGLEKMLLSIISSVESES
jgi:hypothetical protein